MLKRNIGLFLILFLAFILRVWGIGFGLPAVFHVDERLFPYNAIYALSHNLHIATTLYGNLLPYLLSLLYMGYYFLLLVIGVVRTPTEFIAKYYYENPTTIYLIGKFMMVIFSCGAVWMIYQISKKLFNQRTALIGAVFLATAFLWVAETKVMKGDIPGTFFILCSLNFMLNRPTFRSSLLAGIFWGLAMGARYYFVSFLIPALLFYFLCTKSAKKVAIFVGTGLITFLLVTPAIFLQFDNMVYCISTEIRRQTSGPWIDPGSYPVWLYFLLVHLPQGLGTFFLLSSLIGGLSVLLQRNLKHIILLLCFPIIYFIILNNTTNFARYSLPLIPFFAMLSANLVESLSMSIRARTTLRYCLMITLICAIVYPGLLNIVRYNYLISQLDTRLIAKQWIESNIPSGTKIVNEGGEGYEEISIIGVPLHKEPSLLKKRMEEAISKGTRGRSFQIMQEVNKRRKAVYDIRNPYRVDEVKSYAEEGVEYIVLINWGRRNTRSAEFTTSLLEHYELIKVFLPHPVFRWDIYCYQLDYEALRRVNIFDKEIRPGPIIEVYRKKQPKRNAEE